MTDRKPAQHPVSCSEGMELLAVEFDRWWRAQQEEHGTDAFQKLLTPNEWAEQFVIWATLTECANAI